MYWVEICVPKAKKRQIERGKEKYVNLYLFAIGRMMGLGDDAY